MKLLLRNIYNVDTLSQDKGWERVRMELDKLNSGEEIELEMSGVNIHEPWDSINFKQILSTYNIKMVFTNENDLVNRIKMMCIFDGIDDSKVVNIKISNEEVLSPHQLRVEKCGKDIVSYFRINENGQAVLKLSDKYSQMYNSATLDYIDYAIKSINNDKGITDFILDMNGIITLDNVLENIADMIIKYEIDGIKLSVDISNEDYIKSIKMFLYKSTSRTYDNSSRLRALNKHLSKNEAGILIKYKKSRAVDEFGRHGRGEVVSSRIALFVGIERNIMNNVVSVIFKSFDSNYFYTRQSWMIEHDNEIPESLKYDIVKIKLGGLGIGDLFIGSDYHFIKPIQMDASESRVIPYDIDDNDRILKKAYTIPERIKSVLDDWNIEYDVDKLNYAINETNRMLKKENEE